MTTPVRAVKAGSEARAPPGHRGRRVRFHDLGLTFASWCERHCTFAAVQRLLGHAPQSMTHRYVHVNMDELRKEVERIPWLEPKAAGGRETGAARV